jgi:uncharacterized protein HemY
MKLLVWLFLLLVLAAIIVPIWFFYHKTTVVLAIPVTIITWVIAVVASEKLELNL